MKDKLFLILSILSLTTPLLAQDIMAIKKKEALPAEEKEEGFQIILPPGINIEPRIDAEQEIINIASFPMEGVNNQKFLPSLLRDRNPWTRAEVVKVLGEIGSQEAAPSLGKILKEDKNPHVRYSAAWALGKIGGAESLPALKKALKKEEDRQVKRMIVESMKRIERIKVKR